MIAFVLGLSLQISALAAVALVAVALMRRASAALRHWVLAAAVVGAACLPALQFVVPSWGAGLLPLPDAQRPAAVLGLTTASASPAPSAPANPPAAPGPADSLAGASARAIVDWLPTAWLLGVDIGLALLAAGLLRLAWLTWHARPMTHPVWTRLAADISAELGLRRPVTVLQVDRPSILAAWGWRRPTVMVPPGAESWTEADVRVVLRHEIAHLARGDWFIQLLAEAVRAFNWFNPLTWILPRRLRTESERACDDVVLRRGVDGTEYAERLLAIARTLNEPRLLSPVYPAPSMARPSSLEGRVAAMLSRRTNRAPVSASARAVVVIAAILIALPVAGLVVWAQSQTSFTGSVLDPMNRAVQNVRIVFTNAETGVKFEGKTDGFTVADLPMGRYQMVVSQPGFMSIKSEVVLKEEGGKGKYVLKLGSLMETIVVQVSDTPDAAAAAAPKVPAGAARPTPGAPALPPCQDTGTTGGNIIPPRKLVDVKPQYPDQLRASKVAGTVRLEATVGGDGKVRDITVVETPHVDLGLAVADAVGRWIFTPTRLNCEAVDVKIGVTANFVYR